MSDDSLFAYDEDAVAALRKDKPWVKNLKHFTECKVSALAAMKMLKHALAGVAEGRAERGVAVEIMGLLIGKPDGNSIVVTDVFPLPVKGIEYQVNVLDQAMVYITRVQDATEARRRERFVDVITQAGWQALAPFWTAIVIDPLRSAQQGALDMGAYRTYPASFTPPTAEAPDGSLMPDSTERHRRWGLSCGRYYALTTSYFASSAGIPLVQQTAASALWVSALSATPGRDRAALTAAADNAARARGMLAAEADSCGAKKAVVEGQGVREMAKVGACQCGAAAETVMKVMALSLQRQEAGGEQVMSEDGDA